MSFLLHQSFTKKCKIINEVKTKFIKIVKFKIAPHPSCTKENLFYPLL